MEKNYFEDEVRSGFYVPGMVKRCWAAQLEVLAEVERICKKYQITYFAEWGTLLGAVRHKGFIPWDDDMDICMKRADYNKFLQVAPQEFTGEYNLSNLYIDPDSTELLTRIINTRTIHLDDEFLQKFHQFPFSAGLDIFPLDYISANEEENATQMQLMDLVAAFAYAYEPDAVDWGASAIYLEQIEQLCGTKFDRTKPIRQQLLILLDRLCGLYGPEDAEYITGMALWKENQTYKIPKSYYDEAVYVPFEDTEIPVPVAYDAILRLKYGDYMRLVKDGSSHDYPFYKKQEKVLLERTGIHLRQYECPAKIHRKRTVGKAPEEQKTILFLPSRADKWNAMESVWEAACKDEHAKVIVAPIPYFHRGYKGEQLDYCDERTQFPKEVEITDFETLDLKNMHPDIIYIQEPGDEYGKCMSIHPDYYTSQIYNYTDQLVYIPWFLLDEFDETDGRSYINMENYCTVPGLVYADRVLVQSENMKNIYLRKLTEWAGEETRPIWEEKLDASVFPMTDWVKKQREKLSEVPEEWKRLLYDGNGQKKKVIVYSSNASGIAEYREREIEKIRKVFEVFEEQQDQVALIWHPIGMTEELTQTVPPVIRQEYQTLEQSYLQEGWGIYLPENSDEVSKERLLAIADAYYGDTGELAHQFSQEKKPVMLESRDIK
jgi:phosphorylcholine metabolism protein LicD